MKKIIRFFLITLLIIGSSFFGYKYYQIYNSFEYKLEKIGYNEQEVTVLNEKLNEEQLNILINNNYLNIVNVINHEKFDINKFDDYISLLQENKDIETIFIEFDLQNEKYYIDNYLERYLVYIEKYPDKSMTEVIKCVNSGIDSDFYTNMQSTDLSKGHLILVNKFNTLDKSYSPKLVSVAKYGWGYLEEETAKAYIEMYNAAKKDNMKLSIVSPYRSYDKQKNLYNDYVKRDGVAKADTYSARPGSSEHQTGMAVDINTSSSAANFESSNEYKWLLNNSYKYGFIIRYPKGSEYITGYKFEPWHYRYVGVPAATKIHEENITFEEYYAYYVLNENR